MIGVTPPAAPSAPGDLIPQSGRVRNRFRPAPVTRTLLVVCALILAPGLASSFWPFRDRDYPAPDEDLRGAAAAILSRSIRLATVNPPGNERPLAELLVRILRQEGLAARVVETPPGRSHAGRAAAWARLRGSGEQPPILLLSHLDVVPADAETWAFDPFAGVVAGGYVVGRGALDAKGVAVVHLLALVELARRGVRLDRDVILLSTPDEETGGHDGSGFLVNRHPELLGRAEYVLTEGGGILMGEGGRPNIWGVAVTEKTPCWMQVVARGAPGHASSAGQDGAVERLVAGLARLRHMHDAVRVVPEVSRMFAALAPLAAEQDRAGLERLEEALSQDPAFRQRFLADAPRAALVRNTLAITVLRAGLSTNMVPAEARAEIDARLVPGERCDQFVDRVRRVLGDRGLRVEVTLSFDAGSSPVETALFRAIATVAQEMDPGSLVVPRAIAGFTDAHYFRELGMVVYGFVPRWLPPVETRGIHGPNERISSENLERGVRTLVRILEVLGQARDPR